MGETLVPEQEEALKRRILFTPCATKESLHRWIRLFLGIDLPDCIVDPDSNSSPMGMVWETYSKALENDPSFNRVMYYASRDSMKTLGAAILELLMVMHLNRNVAHMAAIEAQSGKSQQYIKGFLAKPILRDFIVGDAKEKTEILRYHDSRTGESISASQFKELPEVERSLYVEIRNYIRVVICSMAGSNSEHVPMFVVDEIEVVRDKRAFEESKMIPAPMNGQHPITLLTSSRKFSFGLVQQEIDNEFDKNGDRRIHIRHWNLIDVTEACPPERHLPDRPKIPIYVDEPNLSAVSEEKYNTLSPEERAKYGKMEGYEGCLSNCRIFAQCRSLLATRQKSTSPLLRPIAHTQNQFRTVSIPTANAQLLCRKPSTEGLIYPHLDRSIHMLTPAQIAHKITGEEFRPDLTKAELIVFLKARGVRFSAGMDFGYTHNFAVPLAAIDGARAFVIHAICQPELLPDAQIAKCNSEIKHFHPSVWADPENPQLVMMFKKAGYRMREWNKGSGSVNGGIDIVRMRLRPTIGEPLLFFLAGDPGVELLFKQLSQYHWTLDASSGLPTDVPDETDDDLPDALRYLIMNEFPPNKRIVQRPANDTKPVPTPQETFKQHTANWFSRWKQEHGIVEGGQDGQAGKKGNFKWVLS